MKLISRCARLPGGFICILRKGYRRGLMYLLRPCFHSYGRNFVFDPFGIYSFKAISVGDDVWIGSRVTVLKGVTIGRGAIVAAGTLVTKTVPPYTVAGGVPARVRKTRWALEEILEHEKALYPPEERLEKKDLYRSHSENLKE